MKIAIVGAGNVGKALGAAWKGAKQDVVYALREGSDKAKPLGKDGFAIASMADAAKAADVIVLAIPFTEAATVIEVLGPLRGKIVIDATNPVSPDLKIELGFDDFAGETVALLAQGRARGEGVQHHRRGKHGEGEGLSGEAGDVRRRRRRWREKDGAETCRGDRLRGDRRGAVEGEPLSRADGDAMDQARLRCASASSSRLRWCRR